MSSSLQWRPALVLAALALGLAAPAFAESGKTPPEPSIPFANRGGIKDWQADRDRGVWIQDIHGKWFYAGLMSPCTGLDFAQTLGFDTKPMGNFDRWSAIVVPRWGRCVVQTFAPSGPPPRKQKVNATKPVAENATPAENVAPAGDATSVGDAAAAEIAPRADSAREDAKGR